MSAAIVISSTILVLCAQPSRAQLGSEHWLWRSMMTDTIAKAGITLHRHATDSTGLGRLPRAHRWSTWLWGSILLLSPLLEARSIFRSSARPVIVLSVRNRPVALRSGAQRCLPSRRSIAACTHRTIGIPLIIVVFVIAVVKAAAPAIWLIVLCGIWRLMSVPAIMILLIGIRAKCAALMRGIG